MRVQVKVPRILNCSNRYVWVVSIMVCCSCTSRETGPWHGYWSSIL